MAKGKNSHTYIRYSITSFKLVGLSNKLALTIISLEPSTCLQKACNNLVTNAKIVGITINLDKLILDLKGTC